MVVFLKTSNLPNKRIYRNYFQKKDIPIFNIPIFISKTPTASTLQVVDLGFDIAVVLCGVNDGKKFFVGFREKRDDVMFFFWEAVEIPENNKRFTKITPKETQG